MPPKRKQSAATPSAPKARRSKLAKDNEITADQESEIREAFNLFLKSPSSTTSPIENAIPAADVRRALIALNAPPTDTSELQELLEAADADESGWVDYEHFVAIAALKLKSRDEVGDEEEVRRAFALFTKGEEREITVQDLRRVARDLREEVPESVLKDMVREAKGGGSGGVGFEEFEGVMRRAGVFG